MISNYVGSRLLGTIREIKAIRNEHRIADQLRCTPEDSEHCAPEEQHGIASGPVDQSIPKSSVEKINKKPLYIRLLVTLFAFAIGVYFLIDGEAMPGAILISTVAGYWIH